MPAVAVCISTIYMLERRGFELGAAARALVPSSAQHWDLRSIANAARGRRAGGINLVGRFEHLVGSRGVSGSVGVLVRWR